MTELSAESCSALDDAAIDDDAAPQAGADDGRNRCGALLTAKQREMSPQRTRIPVIEIRHRFTENSLEAGAYVKPDPLGMREVGRALHAQNAVCRRRPRRIEADRDDVLCPNSCDRRGQFEAVGNLTQTGLRSVGGARRVLAQTFDEPSTSLVHERVVDGGSAEIDSSNDRHGRYYLPRHVVRALTATSFSQP